MKTDISCLTSHDILTDGNAYIILPGGIEIFSVAMHLIEKGERGDTNCPIILLNTEHFWEPIEQMISTMNQEGFSNATANNLYILDDIDEIVKLLIR